MATGTSATEDAGSDFVEWHPAALVQGRNTRQPAPEFALIVLNQPIKNHLAVIRLLWHNASVRVAADGGANLLYEVGGQRGDASFDDLRVIIGDLDSLSDETRAYYESRTLPPSKEATQVIHDPDQYSTDFGKAVAHTREHFCSLEPARPLDIVAVGGLGGRVDQGLSQVHHLYLFQTHPRYEDGRLYLFSGESLTFLLKAGHHRIRVRDGPAGEADVFDKYVGILPVKEPSRITTKGLEWDVKDWETEFGGHLSTSNHVLPETQAVEVYTTKDVVFTIALRHA
ncbi:thiamine pyrophosphokinase [Lasiosphaeria miniovina]|uniref:Thiamine pyrophosphokinase n=1 Tax=Lasiosphaeria miniovina TaxID=1954250 RepID=A0AA40E3A9_9PEZI|nr:thiamine pyrophosphokinase [Lasiosphaeria miniovina]KAK0723472.1 thiamine pyrophosphokinase [Lasiosphaeria miniovina]